MTNGISEQLSLLASLVAKESRESTANNLGTKTNDIFAGKLDSILANDTQSPQTNLTRSQSLAEALNLQMLHTTLSLAGDATGETPGSQFFNRQSATIQALVKAYSANQPDTGSQPEQATGAVTQLQDLSESDPISATQLATAEKGSQWLDPIIAKASKRYGVEMGLIKAVIKAESNFNPNAVSSAGAQGLMQLMPGTARALGVHNSFDPEQNVMAGTRFLRDLLNRYNGKLDSALAAYNWGPGNVDKRPDHLPRETRDYLARVKQLYSSYTA